MALSASPAGSPRPTNGWFRRFPVVTGILGKVPSRTDSGHSPWQREPLFVPPLALATPLAHSSGRSSTSPTTGGGAKSPLMQIWPAVSGASWGLHSVSWVNTSREPGRANQDQHECVGHAMKPMSEAHFAILRRHMVEVIGIQV